MLPDRKEFKLYQVKLPEAMKLSTQTIFDGNIYFRSHKQNEPLSKEKRNTFL